MSETNQQQESMCVDGGKQRRLYSSTGRMLFERSQTLRTPRVPGCGGCCCFEVVIVSRAGVAGGSRAEDTCAALWSACTVQSDCCGYNGSTTTSVVCFEGDGDGDAVCVPEVREP